MVTKYGNAFPRGNYQGLISGDKANTPAVTTLLVAPNDGVRPTFPTALLSPQDFPKLFSPASESRARGTGTKGSGPWERRVGGRRGWAWGGPCSSPHLGWVT